jgi:hypothetical protein
MAQGLLLTAEKALKLDEDIALIKAIGDVVSNWGALAKQLDGALSAEALLDQIAADVNGDAIKSAFDKVGLSGAYDSLVRFLGRLTGAAGKIPDKYKALLSPLSAFAIDDPRGQVAWTLSTGDKPVLETPRYGIDLGGQAQVGFNAGGSWPDDDPPVKLLTLGASGKAEAKGSATLPNPYGSIQAGVQAAADCAITYAFAAPDKDIFAFAVAVRLAELADPFDFASVWSALGSPDFQGLSYEFGGSATGQIQISFADAGALEAGVTVDLGLTVGVSASLGARYKLAMRRTSLDAGGDGLSVRLSRSKVSEADFNQSLGLEVDVSSLTRPVVDALSRAMGVWDERLGQIRPFLSPGTWLRNQADVALTAKITSLIGDAGLRAAVVADMEAALGAAPADQSSLVGWLQDRIVSAIDRGSTLVDGQLEAAAGKVMGALQGSAPRVLLADAGGALRSLVQSLVQKADGGLTGAVTSAFGDLGAEFAGLLNSVGGKITGAVNSADDALKAVRDLLGRVDATLHKVLDAAEDAAKKKITARLYLEETSSSGETVEVDGVFSASSEGAGKVFEALTRGDLKTLVAVLEGRLKADGFALDLDKSAVTRFSKTHSAEGLELSFLIFELKAGQTIDVEVTSVLDGLGNVHVDTSAHLDKTIAWPFTDRAVSFVDTYALTTAAAFSAAPAAAPAVLDLGIGARFASSSLEWGDVEDFVGGLKTAALFGAGSDASAKAAFDGWSAAAGPGGKIAGEIGASLRLKDHQLRALMQLSSRTAAGLPTSSRQAIVRAAVHALILTGAVQQQKLLRTAGLAAGLFDPQPAPPALEDVVLQYEARIPPGLRPRAGERPDTDNISDVAFEDPSDQDDYVYFLRIAFALNRMVELIDTMGAVYLSRPVAPGGPAGGWTNANYRDAEALMARDSGLWLTVFGEVANLFNSDMTPWTVAALRTLADLAGYEASTPGGAVLNMTWRPPAADPQTAAFG